MSATTTQLLSSGEFCKLYYDTIPVKSASANVSFNTNNSKMPNFRLWHSCRKWAIWTCLRRCCFPDESGRYCKASSREIPILGQCCSTATYSFWSSLIMQPARCTKSRTTNTCIILRDKYIYHSASPTCPGHLDHLQILYHHTRSLVPSLQCVISVAN